MRVAANSSSKIVLQYLRYVLAAAEKHSFRQAAVELGVWESTISRGIRDLEHEMGRRAVYPTSGWRDAH
jgi:DNA-binding transcriptional LysR family regulator